MEAFAVTHQSPRSRQCIDIYFPNRRCWRSATQLSGVCQWGWHSTNLAAGNWTDGANRATTFAGAHNSLALSMATAHWVEGRTSAQDQRRIRRGGNRGATKRGMDNEHCSRANGERCVGWRFARPIAIIAQLVPDRELRLLASSLAAPNRRMRRQ
jgi:hypothetical protein